PRTARRHVRSRRHGHSQQRRVPAPQASTLARESKPEAPETGAGRNSRLGPKLAEGLPNLLVRPMTERQTIDPTAEVPGLERGGTPPVLPRVHLKPNIPKRVESPAPRPVMVARAERPGPLADPVPTHHEDGGLT